MATVIIAVVVWIVVLALFLAGLMISLFGFAGVWLIFIGILISAAYGGFEEVGIIALILFALFAVIVSLVDNFLIPLGAKYTGGSNWAIIGAVIGGIVGLIFGNVLGLIVGPFLGAVTFELIFARKQFKAAFKAGFGTFIGFMVTIGVKFSAAVIMIVLWALLMFL